MIDENPSPEDARSIDRLLAWGIGQLQDCSASAVLDAQLLAMKAFGCSREQILAKIFPHPADAQCDEYLRLVGDRRRHVPIAYLLGNKEFWGLSFEVNPSVLIPRPESELLISQALRAAQKMEGKLSILELGTGSGCLSIALALELKQFKREFSLMAVEKSPKALEVAQRNVDRHSCGDCIALAEGDWFLGLNPRTDTFDLIITNPPYVAAFEKCSPEIYHEPSDALFAQGGGMSEIQRIFGEAPKFLSSQGVILCEVGSGKRSMVHDLLGRPGNLWNYELAGDLSNPNGFTVIVARPNSTSQK